MSNSAVFFIGEGSDAVFLGGQYSHGYIREKDESVGVPKSILLTTTPDEFSGLVKRYLPKASLQMEQRAWDRLKGVGYIYCFFDGHVWITNGGRYFNPFITDKPSRTTPAPPVCRQGGLGGEVTMTCGECRIQDVFDLEQYIKMFDDTQKDLGVISTRVWDATDFYRYFQHKGWSSTGVQGWLCQVCDAE